MCVRVRLQLLWDLKYVRCLILQSRRIAFEFTPPALIGIFPFWYTPYIVEFSTLSPLCSALPWRPVGPWSPRSSACRQGWAGFGGRFSCTLGSGNKGAPGHPNIWLYSLCRRYDHRWWRPDPRAHQDKWNKKYLLLICKIVQHLPEGWYSWQK